jgi:hypothetical protein
MELTAVSVCHCSKTWVLVVHNDFLNVDKYERKGNEVDVANLKRVFQSERNCKFAELQNSNKEHIIGTLASEEQLIKLFYPDNDCKHLNQLIRYFYAEIF